MNNKVALYLRLSKEDLDKLNKEEKSESIKNQEIMLRNYALEQGLIVVGVYEDEDYSGSDRDRPNFNKMIKECEKGNVDIVLVKSQSRFARDIELIDKYIHNKFIEWGIRFISYIERIDNTNYATKKTSQITAMKDEWMLEDTSINIRQTLNSKRINGEFTGSFAVYGYMKDPENKNHLVIDHAVSNNIMRIFLEYNKGYGMNKIAKGLTNDNILSPLEYKLFNGSNLKLPIVRYYNDYSCINKVGTYIIKIKYQNNEKQILKNLTTIEILTDKVLFNNKLDISLNKIKNNNIKIYYSTHSLDELNIKIKNDRLISNNIDFNNNSLWKPVNDLEILPKNITCLATNIKELDRTHEIFYEFVVSLKENRQHLNYYYKVYPISDNENTKLKYEIKIRNRHQWCSSTIKKILKDETYIGNLIQFKTTTVNYKNHTIIYNDKDTQIKVLNTHEPIINLDLWNEVQNKLKQRKKCCKNGQNHLLANKVYCENCHRVFYKCGKNDENGFAYLCCKDKINKWANCSNNKYIKEKFLQEFVIDKINNLLRKYYDLKKQKEINDCMIESDLFKEQINNLNKEKEKINKELVNKKTYLQSLYEDLKKEILDEEQYFTLKEKYQDDYNLLEERIKIIDNNLLSIQKFKKKLKNNSLFKKYIKINELKPEIVNNLIEKIIIGNYDKKKNERKIHIIWNFD